MLCPGCRQQNPDGARFCSQCGAGLGARCRQCGEEMPTAARFCNQCGTPVGASAAAPRLRAPREYTPKHLADKILAQKSALEGERKQVTVLFADVKGSIESPECYVVEVGRAAVTIGRKGVGMVGEGSVVGERGILLDTVRSATVTAIEHMVTYAISRERLRSLVAGNPAARDWMLDEMRRRYPTDA